MKKNRVIILIIIKQIIFHCGRVTTIELCQKRIINIQRIILDMIFVYLMVYCYLMVTINMGIKINRLLMQCHEYSSTININYINSSMFESV